MIIKRAITIIKTTTIQDNQLGNPGIIGFLAELNLFYKIKKNS